MKARYEQATDTLTLILRDAPVAESDEDKPGVILDYAEDSSLVSLEVLTPRSGSKTRMPSPRSRTPEELQAVLRLPSNRFRDGR